MGRRNESELRIKKYDFIQKRYSPEREKKSYKDPANIWRINKIIEMIPRTKLCILDVGCYDGSISELILKKSDGEVYGIELNLSSCRLANLRGIECIQSDVDLIFPFRDETFDLIVAGEIVEHVYDPDLFVSELSRLLKPGGNLILTTPNLTSLGARVSLLLGKRPFFIEPRITEDSAGHLRYFTLDDLKELLADYNLKVTKIRGSTLKLGPIHLGKISSVLADIYPRLAVHLIIEAKKML